MTQAYGVVAHSAQTATSTAMLLTLGNVTERTSDLLAGAPVWDEVLMYGSASDIATTWTVSIGGSECPVEVSREMVEQWGGFSLKSCGDATDISFLFVPIS
jgi:hypothetical protein